MQEPRYDFGDMYGNNTEQSGGMFSPQGGWGNYFKNNSGELGAGIGDLFGSFMMGRQNFKNPANSAMPYFNQIPGMLGGYFNPYIQAGRGAMGNLQGQYGADLGLGKNLRSAYGSMMSDPGALMGKIGGGFKQSPGYQFQVNQALGAANRAAAAGGMEGTPQEQQNIAGVTNNLANQDYYNYLNHGLNIYNQGLSGEQGLYNQGIQGEQGLNEMGYGASRGLGEDIADAMMNQGNLAYNGQINQNEMEGGQTGSIAGMLGQGIGSMAPFIAGMF